MTRSQLYGSHCKRLLRLATRYSGAEAAERMSATGFRAEERMTIRMSIERVDVRGFE